MPLPLILGIAAGAAAIAGIGSGVHGAVKMKEANDTIKDAQERHQKNLGKFEYENQKTDIEMDKVGEKELQILKSFETFSSCFDKIHNRPSFTYIDINGFTLPTYDSKTLKDVSVGANVLLSGLSGAAAGTAGGFAAAGATTAAVATLGFASTGAPISSLSGAAAVNATMAALGGGSLAAGGGGIALGTTFLGAASLGVGILIGSIIFNVTGSKLSYKADEAERQVLEAETQINKICDYLDQLRQTARRFYETLSQVDETYQSHLEKLKYIVNVMDYINWDTFSKKEKQTVENTVLLVTVLYNMCKVKLVLQAKDEKSLNTINTLEINKALNDANKAICSLSN